MNIFQRINNKFKKLIQIFLTFKVKFKFKKFGKNSIILNDCRLNNPNLIEVENNVFIGSFVWLNCGESNDVKTKLQIKSGSHISNYCHINAFNKVVIEDDVLIAENVYLGDTDHRVSERDVPIIKQGYHIKGEVIIKKGSFICKNAVIRAGTTIGEYSIIAPNTFVIQKIIPSNSLVIGNPSKVYKRFSK